MFLLRCSCTNGILKTNQRNCDYTGYTVITGNQSILLIGRTTVFRPAGGITVGVDFDWERNNIFYTVNTGDGSSQIRMLDTKGNDTLLFNGKYLLIVYNITLVLALERH